MIKGDIKRRVRINEAIKEISELKDFKDVDDRLFSKKDMIEFGEYYRNRTFLFDIDKIISKKYKETIYKEFIKQKEDGKD